MFESVLSQFIGHAAQGVRTSDPALDRSLHFLAQLQQFAFGRWMHVARSGVVCAVHFRPPGGGVVRCANSAMGVCMVCKQPVCLEHALVAANGDSVCRFCVHNSLGEKPKQVKVDSKDSPAEIKKLRRRYLQRLELKGSPSEEEIKVAFSRLMAKHHPDKAPPHRRQAAHNKCVRLGEAKQWLLENLKAA